MKTNGDVALKYGRLVEDFLISDRRVADRTDISIRVDSSLGGTSRVGKAENMFARIDLASPRRLFTYLIGTTPFLGVIEIVASHDLDDREAKLVTILGPLTAYAETHISESDCPDLYERIGRGLREVRESLRRSRDSLATELGIPRSRLAKWEHGTQGPGLEVLYRWCHALGLVCPPKTNLVHVVDLSPELLRFLQEDPTRLRLLTPDQFERFVAERLDRMGYNVTLTGATNQKDGGIDLIAVPKSANVGSVVIAGQMKHHQDRKTEREAVDRLLSWKDSFFGVGLLVTNTSFTRDAIWTAQHERNRHFLRLRDFTDLKRWLQDQYGSEQDWREIPDRIELAPGVVIEIPKPKIVLPFDLKN